jgi:hypothetical protein
MRAATGLPLPALADADDALMGAGNALGQASMRPAAGAVGKLGPGAALREGAQSIRALPGVIAEDLKNVSQFDLVHPISQVRNLTPISPLSFLGERAAASESQALNRLSETVLDARDVARQIDIRNVSTGAFVTTWVTGTGLLGRDTFHLVRGESDAVERLLTGAEP